MSTPLRKGTWFQRLLKNVFTILFGLLVYWMLGFLINDIGNFQTPVFSDIEKRMLDPELQKKSDELQAKATDLRRSISTQQTRQSNLRDSTSNAQTTMNQLLEFQKLSLEKNVKPSEEEQQALAASQKVFLSNQQNYQQITEEIGVLQADLNATTSESLKVDEELNEARKPIWDEYNRLTGVQAMWEAGVKLALLTPLLLIPLGLFYNQRNSIYVPLFIAFAIAVAAKVLFVMHEYFPGRSFKYVLLVTFLIVVTRALLVLLKSIAKPGAALLLNQYREAYETFLCPNCNFPIRRGPLKFLYWTRRSIKKLNVLPTVEGNVETPYCCPSCSTQLFEECSSCHHIRHSLLPTCEHCATTTAAALQETK